MFNHVKKLFKTLGSRLVYLFVGLSFALVVIVAQAAISSGTVSSGTRLTSVRWNTMINDLQSLDTRLGTLNTRVVTLETATGSNYELVQCTGTISTQCTPTCPPGLVLDSHINVSSAAYWTGVGLCLRN